MDDPSRKLDCQVASAARQLPTTGKRFNVLKTRLQLEPVSTGTSRRFRLDKK